MEAQVKKSDPFEIVAIQQQSQKYNPAVWASPAHFMQ